MYSTNSGFISILKSFAEWWRIYLEIVESLAIDRRLDEIAAQIAREIANITVPPLEACKSIIMGRSVVIFGAGPSLESHLKLIEKSEVLHDSVLVAADGATKALVEVGITPHIIVSDLDGDLDAILYSALRGSKLFIHIHGDNIDVFTSFTDELKKLTSHFTITTQVEPYYPVLNFGGFTDGDRAYAITLVFKPSQVLLAGMDFGDIIGRYSKPWLKSHEKASVRKRVKLSIAFKIISLLACSSNTATYTFSKITPMCVKKIDNLEYLERNFRV
jgi:uncharacterized Rossmann fold enzyme